MSAFVANGAQPDQKVIGALFFRPELAVCVVEIERFHALLISETHQFRTSFRNCTSAILFNVG